MTKLFISRKISIDSPFKKVAFESVSIIDKSLIQFEYVSIPQPNADWLFFYSKTGINAFMQQYPHVGDQYNWACYGPKTAEYLSSQYNIKSDFVGTGEESSSVQNWSDQVPDNQSISFLRAQHSQRSMIDLLKEKYSLQEVIIYNQKANDEPLASDFRLAILTSPLNVDAFINNHGKAENYVAIGPTTAEAFTKYGVSPHISDQMSEESLANKALEILGLQDHR